MKTPKSLIDKVIHLTSQYGYERYNVPYVDHQVSVALEKYPDSIMIKNLTDIIKQLQLDVIETRMHLMWLEHTDEAL